MFPSFSKRFFNLVEVTLSLAIIGFAVSGIMSLFFIALRSHQDAIGENYTANTANNFFSLISMKAATSPWSEEWGVAGIPFSMDGLRPDFGNDHNAFWVKTFIENCYASSKIVSGGILFIDETQDRYKEFSPIISNIGLHHAYTDDQILAMEKLKGNNYLMVILDSCEEEEEEECQFVKDIRKEEIKTQLEEESYPIPIIILRPEGSDENWKCRDAGSSDYMAEPFCAVTITSMLKKWIPHDVYNELSGGAGSLGLFRMVLGNDFDGVIRIWQTPIKNLNMPVLDQPIEFLSPKLGVGINVEISWPYGIPHDKRKNKRLYYYELFNSDY